jgi:hypothetical protein
MAKLVAAKSGKATAAIWKNEAAEEVKFKAGDDLVVPTGVAVEWNSALVPRSLIWEAGSTRSGTGEISAGASTAQSENIVLKVASGATDTWVGITNFISTFSATPQTISLGGHALGGKVLFAKSASLKLLEPLKVTAAQVVLEETAQLNLNAQNSEAAYWQVLGKALLNLASTVVKVTASSFGEGWHVEPTASVTTGSSLIEFTDKNGSVEKQFNGGGKAYNTVKFVSFTKVEASNSYALFNAFNAGAEEGKGIRVVPGTVQTCTAINFNGKAGEPGRLESSEAGKRWKLVLPAGGYQPANSFGVVKDVEATEAAPLYVPNAVAIENCLFVYKEPQFSSNPTLRAGAALTAKGSKVAESTATIRAATLSTGTGSKTGAGEAQIRAAAHGTAQGSKTASGTSTVRAGGQATALAAKLATGVTSLIAAARQVAAGSKGAQGDPKLTAGSHASALGAKTASGVASMPGGVVLLGVGRKLASSIATLRAALRLSCSSRKPPEQAPPLFTSSADSPLINMGATDRTSVYMGSGDVLLTDSDAGDL